MSCISLTRVEIRRGHEGRARNLYQKTCNSPEFRTKHSSLHVASACLSISVEGKTTLANFPAFDEMIKNR